MKSRLKRLMPNASMAVALLALFVALSGSAYAGVKLSKNSVTTKTIKNGAVTTKKIKKRTITSSNIKNNTLTGTQINESKLGVVPQAANAATLGGANPASFFPSSAMIRFNVVMNRGDAPKTLATFGPFTLTGYCTPNGPTNFDMKMTVTTSVDGTYVNGNDTFNIADTYDIFTDPNASPTARNYDYAEPRFLDPASGFSIMDGDGSQLGAWYGFPGANCRFVSSMIAN